MARLGVTYQDVANAAGRLLGQGKQPTIELIRQLLGTGSVTTLAKHLRQWRSEQTRSVVQATQESLPAELVSLMKGLWDRVQKDAEAQIEAMKQTTNQRIKELEQDLNKYRHNNQRWQKLHDTWVKEKHSLTQENAAMKSEISALSIKHDAQYQQLTEKQKRIDELHRLHKLAQENLEYYRESTRVQRIIDQEKFAKQLKQIQKMVKAKVE